MTDEEKGVRFLAKYDKRKKTKEQLLAEWRRLGKDKKKHILGMYKYEFASENAIYCTSFCNKGHRVRDGKPVGHECYVLNPEALAAEMDGDYEKCREIGMYKSDRPHPGLPTEDTSDT